MRVTVLMPVYNAGAYLSSAIESVLNQTHRDFELILINDGSTDASESVMRGYAEQDSRVQVMSHANCGMGESLNRALQVAQTDWVVRMDGDDLMHPERLARQIEFIQQHPDLKVTACLAQYISETGKPLAQTTSDLTTIARFQWYLAQQEAIGLFHPGVAMHRESVLTVGGYRGAFWPADDIDLWNRVAEQGHLILVQPEVLMQYRLHAQSAITASFMKGRLKYEWVRTCMRARRAGQAEPTWDEFVSQWQARPLLTRLNWQRKTRAKELYRKAGHDHLAGHTLKAFWELMLATGLQPGYTLSRLIKQGTKARTP